MSLINPDPQAVIKFQNNSRPLIILAERDCKTISFEVSISSEFIMGVKIWEAHILGDEFDPENPPTQLGGTTTSLDLITYEEV